ncbi:MAG: hypothetical protein M3Y62_01845 [Candidatus Dormibacteraeota bacterium]|nr:hypothetical protein [Candidatus Dormibacteraeota bacterium]
MAGQISPDGRWWWDGRQWQPYGLPPGSPATRRVPTAWTRPLQIAIIALLVVGLINGVAVLFWLPDYMQAAMNASIDRQAQLSPNLDPAQVEQIRQQTRQLAQMIFTVSLGVGIVLALAYFALATIGTLHRWTWWFWVQLVLAGLAVLSRPQNVLALSGRTIRASPSAPPLHVPVASAAVNVLLALAWLAVFIWMIVAYRRFGPWACRRVPG